MIRKIGFIISLCFITILLIFAKNYHDTVYSVQKDIFWSTLSKDDLNSELHKIKKLSEDYEKNGNTKNALNYYKIWSDLKDSMLIATFLEQISTNEDQYQYKANEIALRIEQLEYEKNIVERQKNILTVILIVFLIISLAMGSFFIYFRNGIHKKPFIPLNTSSSKLNAIREKPSLLEQELSDIKYYATLVQSALLTSDSLFGENFREHFIFFKPKEQIGGDFYWIIKKNPKVLVALGDCTGHGVHGALLSILGITYLTEIANSSNLDYSDEILNQLKEKFLKGIEQMGKMSESKDGIDIAICILDYEKMEAQFSGAYNPLYIISNNNLENLRGDKLQIGYSEKEDTYFTRQNFKINEGDIIYLFTDGYCDQFGGENRKKFMTKRFSHLLLNIYQFPMEKQKEWLDKTLYDWMKDNDQVDDITVIGLKI